MATARTKTAGLSDEGRLYEIREELDKKRRGPYILTSDIHIQPLTRGQARKLREARGDEDAQLKIILGEHFDAVNAIYDELPLDEWIEFNKDLNEHFYGRGATEVPGGSTGS
ncbi:hypothetical protein [Rhodococcoides fascians]|uniref:hypothetical protein n=1 Tax=Rhodococcoides fascians TaxID=1828 RepID=UPI000559C547|nr:hypothetical protein [Rhodococcus fascians]